MRLPDLVTLGEAFEDLVFLGLPKLPALGEEVKTSRFAPTIGGGAIITAVAARRLGLQSRVLSGLSDDAEKRLSSEGVQIANLRRPNELHAITAVLSTRANRSFVTFNGINDVLEERLLEKLPAIAARHVHMALYPRHCRAWRKAVTKLRARGVTTSWDFGWNEGLLGDKHFPELLDALDVVFFNEQEARLYARRATIEEALNVWRGLQPDVIVKIGRKGSHWVSRTGDVSASAPRVKVVDSTGAGDAFNGGFLFARLKGWPPRVCLRVGNIVGALSTRAPGGLDGLPKALEVRRHASEADWPTSSPTGSRRRKPRADRAR